MIQGTHRTGENFFVFFDFYSFLNRTETYSVVVLYAYNTIKLLKQALLQTFSVDIG